MNRIPDWTPVEALLLADTDRDELYAIVYLLAHGDEPEARRRALAIFEDYDE